MFVAARFVRVLTHDFLLLWTSIVRHMVTKDRVKIFVRITSKAIENRSFCYTNVRKRDIPNIFDA